MQWSKQQDDVLVKTSAWLKDDSAQQVFRLFGFAGTGKTTLAYALADGVDGEVMFGAYTGKAVHVMKTKGCNNAQTIHSMIYHAKEKSREALQKHETQLVEAIQSLEEEHAEKTPDQRRTMIDAHVDVIMLRHEIEKEKKALAQPSFMLNHESEIQGAALVIIDECSMVDARMGRRLAIIRHQGVGAGRSGPAAASLWVRVFYGLRARCHAHRNPPTGQRQPYCSHGHQGP